MSSVITPFGNETASDLRVASRQTPFGPSIIVSLQDLLDILALTPSSQEKMLRSTASLISSYFERPCSGVLIEAVAENRAEFSRHLTQKKYKKNSIRSYQNYVRILVEKARELGWVASRPLIPETWAAISTIAIKQNCMRPLKFLAKLGVSPCDVSEEDLSGFIKAMVELDESYPYAVWQTGNLRKILITDGSNLKLSNERVRKALYGAAITEFPVALREEVEALLRWKQDAFAPGRPSKAQIRPVSANVLKRTFCELLGYARKNAGHCDVGSIGQLVTQEIVSSFVVWSLSERKVKSYSLTPRLGLLYAALRYHPKYKLLDLQWFPELINTIPPDDEDEAIARKERKYLPYKVLTEIPELIRARRTSAAKRGKQALALEVRNELLVKWLVILPWRQRNIRECRMGGIRPNLLRSKVMDYQSIAKPEWVEEAEGQDPETEFWQFDFSRHETKTKNKMRCILPRQLVPLLEEYIEQHREALVKGSDPGTLFLNEAGKPLSTIQLCRLVKELTLRHGGKAVNPHLFRDIFAYMWLERFPEDFLTLSKLLWHRNIKTTLLIYGRKYNESSALCRMERLL
jgi:integrase